MGSVRPPESYVRGPGYSVEVPARIAAILVNYGGLSLFQQRIRGRDAELDSVLIALIVAEKTYLSSVGGTILVETPEHREDLVLTSTAAAVLLGITPRGVLAAIARGALHGERKTGRVWSIERTELDRYRRTKK